MLINNILMYEKNIVGIYILDNINIDYIYYQLEKYCSKIQYNSFGFSKAKECPPSLVV